MTPVTVCSRQSHARAELRRCAAAGLALALAASLPAAAIDVSVSRSPGFDFAAVATFGWRVPEREEGHPLSEGGRYDVRVREIVDRALLARGLSQVEGDETPDLWLTWDGVTHPGYELEGVHVDLGPITWIGDPDAHEAYAYERGILALGAVDPGSGDIVWRGLATDIVDVGRTDKILAKLETAARRLIGHFPAR
jgi:hypothetical protein